MLKRVSDLNFKFVMGQEKELKNEEPDYNNQQKVSHHVHTKVNTKNKHLDKKSSKQSYKSPHANTPQIDSKFECYYTPNLYKPYKNQSTKPTKKFSLNPQTDCHQNYKKTKSFNPKIKPKNKQPPPPCSFFLKKKNSPLSAIQLNQ